MKQRKEDVCGTVKIKVPANVSIKDAEQVTSCSFGTFVIKTFIEDQRFCIPTEEKNSLQLLLASFRLTEAFGNAVPGSVIEISEDDFGLIVNFMYNPSIVYLTSFCFKIKPFFDALLGAEKVAF